MGKLGLALFLFLGLAVFGWTQDYNGPVPEKADVPYLLHAENLVETEVAEARSEERKNETANILSGASSPVRTPIAEPIFIFKSGEIDASKLGLWHFEVVKGNREIAFPTDTRKRLRNGPFPIHLSVRKLSDNLYRLEANEMLDNGQYCLSPEGSQKVFCFEQY